MALTSKEIAQHITQSEEAFRNKEYSQATTILNGIILNNPDYAPAYRRMGSILMLSQSQEKALAYINKAIELVPEDGENWKVLGYFYKNRKAWAEALQAFQKALELSGENIQLYSEVLQIHRILGNYSNAFSVVQKLQQMEPDNITYLWKYAQMLKEMGRDEEALGQYNLLMNRSDAKVLPDAMGEWYELMVQFRFIKEVRSRLQLLSQNNPNNVKLKILYGYSCEADMDDEEALKVFRDAHRLFPDNLDIIYGLGISYKRMGDIDKFAEYLKKMLDENPLHISSLLAMSSSHKFHYGDDLFKKLNFAMAHISELSSTKKAELHYALGKAYDDVDDMVTAFEHYRSGGVLHSHGRGQTDFITTERQLVRAKSILRKDFFENNTVNGFRSKKPIFIIGMPRSGTSLIEQVLSGIDGIYGAGELEYNMDILNQMEIGDFKLDFGRRKSYFPNMKNPGYLDRGARYVELMEALAPEESKFIIDKVPNNFVWLGYLHLILPDASIIHSRRHPVETCLSAYRLYFSAGQYWSDDLRTMGRYYRLYTELMSHWKSALPEGAILDVRYEDMVTDLETQSKRLTDYIGIPWNASCLKFHESKRAVRTASVSQVRKPIYQTSMNRWRKYEPYLKPLLDEIEDLVEDYEAELIINQ